MNRKQGIFVATLLAMAVAVYFFPPLSQGYNTEQAHPRLRSLQAPYRSVTTEYVGDGGSIGIEIVDRDGKCERFSIPAPLGEPDHYSKVYVGAMRYKDPSSIEITEPAHTKQMLIHVLASKPGKTAYDDLCLMALRRRPSDYVRVLFDKWAGKFE